MTSPYSFLLILDWFDYLVSITIIVTVVLRARGELPQRMVVKQLVLRHCGDPSEAHKDEDKTNYKKNHNHMTAKADMCRLRVNMAGRYWTQWKHLGFKVTPYL